MGFRTLSGFQGISKVIWFPAWYAGLRLSNAFGVSGIGLFPALEDFVDTAANDGACFAAI